MLYHSIMVRSIIVALFGLMAAFAQTAPAPLLITGAFHGNEVEARSGERWIALIPSALGFEWRAVTVSHVGFKMP